MKKEEKLVYVEFIIEDADIADIISLTLNNVNSSIRMCELIYVTRAFNEVAYFEIEIPKNLSMSLLIKKNKKR